jgi:hypothetical protein
LYEAVYSKALSAFRSEKNRQKTEKKKDTNPKDSQKTDEDG